MDFFDAQDRARRLSGWLVVLFALAVLLIALTVYLAVALVLLPEEAPLWWWQPGLFAMVVGGVGALVGICSGVRTASLRSGGGSSVAEMLGGRQVLPLTADPDEQRFRNVVEEMALAAGVPVPAMYVLDSEGGINAFAAGYSPEDAVVAVTRGALEGLSRDELQGVVAHEFSHIVNRDIRLNIRLTGLLFGILALGLAGRILLRSMYHMRGGGKNRGQALAVAFALGLTLYLAGYLGVFFGRIIRAAVSRQREFLADAAAVQFTRNPAGLAGALKKIGAVGSRIDSASAEEVSHFFFASGLRHGLVSGVWSTHPPLVERIRRLEPAFDGDFSRIRLGRAVDAPAASPRTGGHHSVSDVGAGPALLTPLASVVANTGAGAPATSVAAARLLDVPEGVRDAAHDPFAAVGLMYALMLSREEGSREQQRAVLEQEVSLPLLSEVNRLRPTVEALEPESRLALIDLVAPALHQLSDAQAQKLTHVLGEVARADRHLSLFEFSLETAVRHRLAATHGFAGHGQRLSLDEVMPSAIVMLSALAHVGQDSPEAARAAFVTGAQSLDSSVQPDALVGTTSGEVVDALERLSEARAPVRARAMAASMRTVLHDGEVRDEEAHLLRALAAALDLPAPAFLPRFSPPAGQATG
jgi:Zn-dependent protease with chaperone function